MTRRNPPAKWTLPDNINPATSTCYTIPVPDDPFHRAAFWGALLDLASAYKWADDPDHKAREVALVWRNIVDALRPGPCNDGSTGPIDFNMEEFMSCLCEVLRWHNGKLQALCCGDWTDIPGFESVITDGGTQPPPGGVLAPGQCQTYNAVLQANGQFLLPNPVQEGYTIEISGVVGGWTDGAVWYCPDGGNYILGVCNPAGKHHVGGDPDATAYHMQLMALINGIYYPVVMGSTTSITVPSGTPASEVSFVANDASLSDNGGSVNFQVQVCAPQSAADTVAVCYPAGGSGPSSIQKGVPFTVTAGLNPNGHTVITMGFDQDLTLTILDLDGWQQRTGSGETIYAFNTGQNACDINHIFAGTIVLYGAGNLPLQLACSCVYIDAQNTGWTMQFQVD